VRDLRVGGEKRQLIADRREDRCASFLSEQLDRATKVRKQITEKEWGEGERVQENRFLRRRESPAKLGMRGLRGTIP
jgi:hypothetical protein